MSGTEKKKVSLTGKQYLMVWFESLGWTGVMVMGYFFSTYNALIGDTFGYDVGQMANLIAIMSFTGAIGNFAGGFLADLIKIKVNMTIAYAGLVACGVIVLMMPGYGIMKLLAIAISVFGLGFYTIPTMRYVASLGTREQESKLYGMFYGLSALDAMVIAPITSKVINSSGSYAGLRVIIIFFCALMVISWVLHMVWIEPNIKENASMQVTSQKFNIKEVGGVIKNVNFWFFLIICVFTVLPYDLNTFVQPLLASEFGASQSVIQFVATYANNGTALILAPLAGTIALKLGSTCRTIMFSFIGALVSSAALLILPWEHKFFAVAVVIIFVLRGVFSIGKPMRNTLLGESRLPKRYRGTALGLMNFVVGLQSTIVAKGAGALTGAYGTNKGFHILYTIAFFLFIIGLLLAVVFTRKLTKAKEQDVRNGGAPEELMV